MVLAILLVIAVGIQVFWNLDIMKVSGAGEQKLEPGDYFYLETDLGTWNWQDFDAKIYFYCTVGGVATNVLMDKVNDNLLRVRIPAGMDTANGFVLRRMSPTNTNLDDWYPSGETAWNQVPGSMQNIQLSTAPDNCNTYRITGNTSGEWVTGTWNISSYGGEELYFMNMDSSESFGNTIKAFFSGKETGASKECEMTLVSGSSCLYSVTIPEDDVYDTVVFKDARGVTVGEEAVWDSAYNPDTANTYYYKRTVKQTGTVLSNFDAYPKENAVIDGQKLYLNWLNFPAGNEEDARIQLGNGTPDTLTTEYDGNRNAIYTYEIPAGTGATQQTVITIMYAGDTYRFLWKDLNNDMAGIYSGAVEVLDKYVGDDENVRAVYFDATLSRLVYGGAEGNGGDYGIPNSSGTIRYYATGLGADLEGDMTLMPAITIDGHTYENVYRVYLPKDYDTIVFSSFDMTSVTNLGGHGESTQALAIPDDLVNPCFYADGSDNIVYKSAGNLQRGGYWDEIGRVRDPEREDSESQKNIVVDIPLKTETRDNGILYLPTTFYDFYSDYELNGENRDGYSDYSTTSFQHQIYQPFRQFNQALSDYYKANQASSPLYWGNMQNYPDSHFDEIGSTLNLYGSTDKNKFFYENNSMWGRNGVELGTSASPAVSASEYATLGLVSDSLKDGNLMIKTANGDAEAPFFSKSYLTGDNSKNTVLGKIYENVSFPFSKKALKSISNTSAKGTVDYWYFDSKEANTNLRMTQDPATGNYYLDSTTEVVKGRTTDKVTDSGNFFPFNGSEQSGDAGRLNYGFGTKLEFQFHLTSSGTVLTDQDEEVPIEFNFSGDDDIWIFVDGKLALDLGGDHGIVTGNLNFKDLTYNISAVKNSQESGADSDSGFSVNKSGSFTLEGNKTDKHTLTLFYMERGLWESNMYLSFNFPDENYLEVEKEINTDNVNKELFGSILDRFSDIDFEFEIKNYATHYEEKEVSTDSGQATGFVTKQYDIPDYGSIAAGGLMYPKGASYTKIAQSAGTSTKSEGEIGDSGTFTLTGDDKVIFNDQFRRGSYLSLKENLDSKYDGLFDTSWTMYEDEAPVIQMAEGNNVNLGSGGTATGLQEINTMEVDDGRTEVYQTGLVDGKQIENSGYTASLKPAGSSFVFRSYQYPDSLTQNTKLKVLYTNTVNTGSIKITKEKAYDLDILDGEYTFIITFSNVGGDGLEGLETISKTITLKNGESDTITGIPFNTSYTITETSSDGSVLNEVREKNGKTFTFNNSTGVVTGTITDDKNTPDYEYTFKNTLKPVIDIEVRKEWKDIDGGTLDAGLPESVTIQLQRRQGTGEFQPVSGVDNVNLTQDWNYTFSGLDKYVDYTAVSPVEWEYRVVELSNGTAVEENGTAGDYKVTYSHENKKDDGIVTDDIIYTITNTYIPKTIIKITKVDASNQNIKLSEVEFKIEKLLSDDTVDSAFSAVTKSTNEQGIVEFQNLPEGKYRLTEIKTKSNYSLLKEPILIVVNRSGGNCTMNGETCTVDINDTISLTVSNRKRFYLPSTGGRGRTVIILTGLLLIWSAGLIYILKDRKKNMHFCETPEDKIEN